MRDVVCVECGGPCELVVPLVVNPVDADRPVLALECGYWECVAGCLRSVPADPPDVAEAEARLSALASSVQFGSLTPEVLASLPVAN